MTKVYGREVNFPSEEYSTNRKDYTTSLTSDKIQDIWGSSHSQRTERVQEVTDGENKTPTHSRHSCSEIKGTMENTWKTPPRSRHRGRDVPLLHRRGHTGLSESPARLAED